MNQKRGLKVLLVGSGGREHALAWKIVQSPRLGHLYVAPGNGGTAGMDKVTNVPIKAMDIRALLTFALKESIDLTIVGPDDPLAAGIVDKFQAKGLAIFGPTRAAARIESSKIFAKRLMRDCGVPTAPFTTHRKFGAAYDCARQLLAKSTLPIVIKATGLALGKGVYVCRTLVAARHALEEIMIKRVYGVAGEAVVIEDFIEGPEVSIHAICSGKMFHMFPAAQDHKRLLDGDDGPNTGGMGTIAPVPWFDLYSTVCWDIVNPILEGLRAHGSPFAGLLYPGLKKPVGGPKVLEFNARFGDPETQVFMRLLKTDLLDLVQACVEERLHEIDVEWNPGFAACIVMASEGYPSPNYKKGVPITGVGVAETCTGVTIFHAGTAMVDGKLVTAGGRVLGVTGVGVTLQEALDRAYSAVEYIRFEGAYYRKDIGAKSIPQMERSGRLGR